MDLRERERERDRERERESNRGTESTTQEVASSICLIQARKIDYLDM